MKLKRKFIESAESVVNWAQVGHRRTAVEYAVAGIKKIHDSNLEVLGRDPLTSEMEGCMQAWVTETLFQGAYMREYHLWEKGCKAYFPAMAERNDSALTMKTKPSQSFTELVSGVLDQFAVIMPSRILDVVEQMRIRVNVMKHDVGLELEHFITEENYIEAMDALEEFWNRLASAEVVGP